jgi:alkylation response protein AidB-like acyl-CoA dehydrogenase
MPTTVDRLLPSEDAEALLELTRDIATKEFAPQVAEMEEKSEFPEQAYRLLGRSGLLSLPFPEEYGGGAQPYEVYLQVVEEIASAWASVGVGVSVHALSCFGLFTAGTDEQRTKWLP